MLNSARRELRLLRDAPPGRRFIRRYNRMNSKRPSPLVRALRIGASGLVVAAGLVMMVMPGPGILITVLGLAMLGGEFGPVSGWMDKSEVKLRQWWADAERFWKRAALPMRVSIVSAFVVCAAAFLIGAYLVLIR